MTDQKRAPEPFVQDGVELDGAGVVAATAVVLGRAAARNELLSDDRDDLAPETLRDFDAFAARVVAAYLHAAADTTSQPK